MAAGGDNLHLHTPESEGGETPTVSVLSADFSKLQVNEELTTPKSVLRSKRSRDVTKRVLFPSQDVTLSPKQPQNPGRNFIAATHPPRCSPYIGPCLGCRGEQENGYACFAMPGCGGI